MAACLAVQTATVAPQWAAAALRGQKAEIHALAIALAVDPCADQAVGTATAAPISADAEIGRGEAREARPPRLRNARNHRRGAITARIHAGAILAVPAGLVHNQQRRERSTSRALLLKHRQRALTV